jgi:Flp pilus assembly protein TadD
MRPEEAKGAGGAIQVAGLLVAAVFLAGCGPKQTLPTDKGLSPPPKSPPVSVDLTDIRSYGKSLKHEGIVNKPLVRYLVSAGQYTLALKHIETLRKESPNDAELYFLKGFALSELGKHREGVKEFKAACDLQKDYAEAWNAMAMTYDLMRKPKDAEQAYLEALKINPNSPKYLNNMGFSFFSRGDYKEAAETYQKALALAPNNVQIHNNLGFAYGMLGRYDEALAEFLQAGTEEVAYNNMGFVYHMLGYNSQAKGMYAKAIETNPHFDKALENLRLISDERKLLPPYPPLL